MFSAWKLWFNGNPGYFCANTGVEKITAHTRIFMKFTLDSIGKKIWEKFNTIWRNFLIRITSAPGNEGMIGFVINEEGCITESNIQSSFDIGLQ